VNLTPYPCLLCNSTETSDRLRPGIYSGFSPYGLLTDEQYVALQAQIKYPWLRAALAVAYRFGFGKSELVSLRVSQVDLKHRAIRLLPGHTRNDRGHVVVMTTDFADLIAECVKGKEPGDPLFTWADGTPINDFRRTWRTLARKAGLPGVLFHDMRLFAVRNMLRAGISKHTAGRISGHSSDSIFDRYDIQDEADLREAA
jgi:integrase